MTYMIGFPSLCSQIRPGMTYNHSIVQELVNVELMDTSEVKT